jgi:outer membrane receptor for monomeric catechols
MKILMLKGHSLKTKMVMMMKRVKRNLKNKVMGQIIVKRTTKDKKNNNKKKIMKKTNMKNKYKQIQILRKIINQLMVVSL